MKRIVIESVFGASVKGRNPFAAEGMQKASVASDDDMYNKKRKSHTTCSTSAQEEDNAMLIHVFRNLPSLPPNLEAFFLFGTCCSLDYFLSCLLIPLRILAAPLIGLKRSDVLCLFFITTSLAVFPLIGDDRLYSTLYHWIRAQSMLKLYLVYNILEAMDRMLANLEMDCADTLLNNSFFAPSDPRAAEWNGAAGGSFFLSRWRKHHPGSEHGRNGSPSGSTQSSPVAPMPTAPTPALSRSQSVVNSDGESGEVSELEEYPDVDLHQLSSRATVSTHPSHSRLSSGTGLDPEHSLTDSGSASLNSSRVESSTKGGKGTLPPSLSAAKQQPLGRLLEGGHSVSGDHRSNSVSPEDQAHKDKTKSRHHRRPETPPHPGAMVMLFVAFLGAIATAAHTFMVLLQVVTINVALNSDNNGLFALLISNNFAEMKSVLWKKNPVELLFVITLRDVVERIQYVVFIVAMLLQHAESSGIGGVEPRDFVTIVFFEMFVDLVKHFFVCRYNGIPLSVYKLFLQVFLFDVAKEKFLSYISISDGDPSNELEGDLGSGGSVGGDATLRTSVLRLASDPRSASKSGGVKKSAAGDSSEEMEQVRARYIKPSSGLLPNPLQRIGFFPFPYVAIMLWSGRHSLLSIWSRCTSPLTDIPLLVIFALLLKTVASTILVGMSMRYLCRSLLMRRQRQTPPPPATAGVAKSSAIAVPVVLNATTAFSESTVHSHSEKSENGKKLRRRRPDSKTKETGRDVKAAAPHGDSRDSSHVAGWSRTNTETSMEEGQQHQHDHQHPLQGKRVDMSPSIHRQHSEFGVSPPVDLNSPFQNRARDQKRLPLLGSTGLREGPHPYGGGPGGEGISPAPRARSQSGDRTEVRRDIFQGTTAATATGPGGKVSNTAVESGGPAPHGKQGPDQHTAIGHHPPTRKLDGEEPELLLLFDPTIGLLNTLKASSRPNVTVKYNGNSSNR